MNEDREYLVDNEIYKEAEIDASTKSRIHKDKYRSGEYGESSQSSNYHNDCNKPRQLPQYVATIAATLSALSAGTVLAWTAPITEELEKGQYRNISVSSDEMGWIGSFVALGAMSLCIPTGFICDLIGRRPTLLLLIIPYSIGWSLIVYANSVFMIYAGRFVTGMASGACCVAAPLYANEIAHKSIRGTLGSYFQLMVTIGIFIAYVVGKYANLYHYTLICACFPFLFFILFVFQPETPIYNMKRGQIDTARSALVYLWGSEYDVDTEIENMKDELQHATQKVSFLESIRKTSVRMSFVIALALMFFQQLSGINAIIFYTSDIFEASGVKIDPKVATIIVGGFQAGGTFVASLVIEKLGRRVLLIGSDLIMAISTIFLGLFFTLKDHHLIVNNTLISLGFLPIVSLCVFVIVFAMGLGPIPWMISSELVVPELKSLVGSAAGTFNWFLAFLVTKFYLQLETAVGEDIMFYAFSTISFLGALFSYLVVPETKGKTVDQIQQELGN